MIDGENPASMEALATTYAHSCPGCRDDGRYELVNVIEQLAIERPARSPVPGRAEVVGARLTGRGRFVPARADLACRSGSRVRP
jgi:hypothetical protein